MKSIKIPREVIFDTDLTDKRMIIFSYLTMRRAFDDTAAFGIQELCRWSNIKPNRNPGKINEKYYDTLNRFASKDYFISHPDFTELMAKRSNSNEYYLLSLNTEKFDIEDNFCLIYEDELRQIIASQLYSSNLLLILSYIRIHINRSPGQPRCCYRLFKTISADTGLSERMVSKCVELLKEMEIIDYDSAAKISSRSTSPKIFADFRVLSRDEDGNLSPDTNYSSKNEIEKQKILMKIRNYEVFNGEKL